MWFLTRPANDSGAWNFVPPNNCAGPLETGQYRLERLMTAVRGSSTAPVRRMRKTITSRSLPSCSDFRAALGQRTEFIFVLYLQVTGWQLHSIEPRL
jgi:hypothetical protein